VSSVPAIDLSLGVVVRDHVVHAVRVVEGQADVASLLRVQVVRVVDRRRRRHDVSDQVEQAARHEPVAELAVSHRHVPRLLDRQVVGVQLGDEQELALLLRGIDQPQSVLVHG